MRRVFSEIERERERELERPVRRVRYLVGFVVCSSQVYMYHATHELQATNLLNCTVPVEMLLNVGTVLTGCGSNFKNEKNGMHTASDNLRKKSTKSRLQIGATRVHKTGTNK